MRTVPCRFLVILTSLWVFLLLGQAVADDAVAPETATEQVERFLETGELKGKPNADDGVMGVIAGAVARLQAGDTDGALAGCGVAVGMGEAWAALSARELGVALGGCSRIVRGAGAARAEDADKLAVRLAELVRGQGLAGERVAEGLTLAFVYGEHAVLRELAEPGGEGEVPYRLRKLAALSWSESFWARADGRRLSKLQAGQMRQLSRRCTEAFEYALAAAPTAFKKVRLSARWSNLLANTQFDGDSEVMRQPLRAAGQKATDPLEAVHRAQLQAFREAVVKAVVETGRWKGKDAEKIADPCVKALEVVVKLRPPQAVVERLIKDTPDFVEHIFPHFVENHSPKGLHLAMTWYLWQAVVLDDPTAMERHVIDRQVHAYARLIRSKLEPIGRDIGDQALAGQYSDRFLKHYRALRDNSLFPYYRHAKGHRLMTEARANIERSAVDVTRRYMKDDGRPGAVRPPAEQAAARRDRAILFCDTLLSDIWFAFTAGDRPGWLCHLPYAVIYSSGGYLHPNGLYSFDVGGVRPWQPYTAN
jgi:hypothetical protein